MDETALISVVVPVYNVASYLPKCIDSIINQTYSNLEIILVDDGSSDNSGFICDDLSLVVHHYLAECGVSNLLCYLVVVSQSGLVGIS